MRGNAATTGELCNGQSNSPRNLGRLLFPRPACSLCWACSDRNIQRILIYNPSVDRHFTFDDATKRVIGYGPWKTQAVFTGTISAITPDEIHFDLVLPFDKIRVGSFTLNRKENWMTSLGFPGRSGLKDLCHLGPPAPVLELWRVLQSEAY